jgi:hypothetical protein
MLSYYISQSNQYVIRVQPTSSAQLSVSLQDMYTLENLTASLSGTTYEPYESYISASMSISGAIVGSQYRAEIFCSGNLDPIWNGSIQVYHSQSIDTSIYENQIPLDGNEVSHQSENRYIILQ